MCGRYSDGGAVNAAIVLRVGPEVVCLGCLKGDPAALVVGLRKREVAVCSSDDDRLANAGGGGEPCSGGGIAALDAQLHEEQAFLNDQQTGQHRQQAHDLAPFDLALLRGSALAPCHQLSPNFWAKR